MRASSLIRAFAAIVALTLGLAGGAAAAQSAGSADGDHTPVTVASQGRAVQHEGVGDRDKNRKRGDKNAEKAEQRGDHAGQEAAQNETEAEAENEAETVDETETESEQTDETSDAE